MPALPCFYGLCGLSVGWFFCRSFMERVWALKWGPPLGPFSSDFDVVFDFQVIYKYLILLAARFYVKAWQIFHAGDRGSNPLGDATFTKTPHENVQCSCGVFIFLAILTCILPE